MTGDVAEVVVAVLPDGHGQARMTASPKELRRQLWRTESKSAGAVIIDGLAPGRTFNGNLEIPHGILAKRVQREPGTIFTEGC
ncbi:hypothetical protein IVA94_17000 [Bradyrhizobium sp. 156]|uniref:hypothetical protein n=1 Tax=Bradyrhizobium sp. 156 TaxID=2782630 RepID=UPI001FF87A29|nr:hypothetical protein [Bradyrhizobium sp. 156]MCK1322561.1 hypothetical protein [Bradyrhizobium sp. 156]